MTDRGKPKRDRLHWLGDARREEARADLGAAGDVHDRRAPTADALEEPEVRVAVPRLAGRGDRPQRRQVGAWISLRAEGAHQRRRDSEHRYALGLDEAPQPILRPVRRAL